MKKTIHKTSVSSKKTKNQFSRFSKSKFNWLFFHHERVTFYLWLLKENELSSEVSNIRKSQVKQLKSYLTLFEQLMANHLSQLSSEIDFFLNRYVKLSDFI